MNTFCRHPAPNDLPIPVCFFLTYILTSPHTLMYHLPPLVTVNDQTRVLRCDPWRSHAESWPDIPGVSVWTIAGRCWTDPRGFVFGMGLGSVGFVFFSPACQVYLFIVGGIQMFSIVSKTEFVFFTLFVSSFDMIQIFNLFLVQKVSSLDVSIVLCENKTRWRNTELGRIFLIGAIQMFSLISRTVLDYFCVCV